MSSTASRHAGSAVAGAPPVVTARNTNAAGSRPAGESAAGTPLRGVPSVSCVIPCFNEAENLCRLLPRLTQLLREHFVDWEIVLVDDGSSDRSEQVLDEWTRRAGVRALVLSRNFGKEVALSAGLQHAVGDVVVTLDADLQHPPELIVPMIERWRHGADMVCAVRADRSGEPALKRWGARLFYGVLNSGGRVQVPDGAGDFRAMDRMVVDALLALPERNRFMKGLYAWVGFRTEAIAYQPPPRESGRSSFSALRLLALSVDALTSFTTWPLRLAGLLGVLLAASAFVYGAVLVVSYLLYGNPVSGWTTLAVSLLLLGGVQLLSIGILGEYLSRVYDEVKQRPLYLVRRHLGTRFPP